MSKIKCTLSRPCLIGGRRVEAGRVELDALAAANLVDMGRATLVDPADLPRLREATRADVARVLREAGRPLPPPADGPWFPIQ